MKAGNIANRTHDYYLPHTDAAKVLSACPDAEWRLIFALSRFAGFRCPSEHLALRWADINWETNRITLDAPKTGVRVLPVFEGVRGYLEDARGCSPQPLRNVLVEIWWIDHPRYLTGRPSGPASTYTHL